jgi:hypothetical protein
VKDLILTVLQAFITASVPILAAFVIKWLNKKSESIVNQIENDTASRYINEISEIVADVVYYVSQTYVDELKKSGTFNTTNQEHALKNAKETAAEYLSEGAKKLIEDTYGDLYSYLELKIEAEINAIKKSNI